MDVNFSNVVEGTRQYFQGLPKASPEDGQHEGSAPSPLRPYWAGGPPPPAGEGALAQSGSPAMASSRPPSEAAEPLLEPEPHIIHKATVMQQAQQARQALLERPPSAGLVSPPSHVIRKPLPAEDCAPAPHYSGRAPPPRTLAVLEPRPYTGRAYPEMAPSAALETQTAARKLPSGPPEAYPHRRYETMEPYPAPEARNVPPTSVHYQSNHKSSLPAQLPQQPSRVAQPQYSRPSSYYPAQNNVDRLPVERDKSTHHLPIRSFQQLTQPQKVRALPVSRPTSIHQTDLSQVRQQTYSQKAVAHQTQPPLSYSRSQEYYSSQRNNKTVTAQDSASRVSKVISSHEYTYSSRVPHHKAVNNHSVASAPAYQEQRLAMPSADQRHPSLTPQLTVNSNRTPHSVQSASISGDHSANHYSRVPPVHPHHHSSRLPNEYQTSKSHLPNSQPYAPEGQQYHILNSSNHSAASGSESSASLSGYHMQSYQSSTVVKQSYDSSPKHNTANMQIRNIPKQSVPVHQPRMTVSVTSLVNQMNVMRQQTRPESTSSAHKSKKESPLDLSVKTVRIPADSTAQDEMENVSYDKRDLVLHHHNINKVNSPRDHIPSNMVTPRQRFQAKVNNTNSHKVDFLPNFNTQNPEKLPAQYRDSNQQIAYPPSRLPSHYDPAYAKPHHGASPYLPKVGSQQIDPQMYGNRYETLPKPNYAGQGYSRRIDHSLPKIDLTLNTDDYEKDHGQHSQSKEDNRKRDDSHIPNHIIPHKVARFESWNHDRHARPNALHQKEGPSVSNHYIPNGTNAPAPSPRHLYENHLYKKSENVEPHSSKHHPLHSQQTHPQQDYYNLTHYNYNYSSVENHISNKQDIITLNSASFQNQNSTTPADKRVLSILRNSLEAKNSESNKIIDDDCIVIPSDDSPPQSVDNVEYQSKKAKHFSEHNRSTEALRLQEVNSNSVPYKVHVPRAVDSIRYDSDSSQKSLKIRDDLQNSAVPVKTEPPASIGSGDQSAPTGELDIAARIRTKAELKGFIQTATNADSASTVTEAKATTLQNAETEVVVTQTHRRRLFSKSDKEKNPSQTNDTSASKKDPTVRNSSDSCVFDFQDSESECEIPSMEKPKSKILPKETAVETAKVIEPIVQVKSEKISDEDSFWTETCDNFLEELKTGKVKKSRRRKNTTSNLDEPSLHYKEDFDTPIKVEKSVIANVVDIVKVEQPSCPLLVKIKEEVVEAKPVSDSSDEDLPLINKKVKKEQSLLANTLCEKGKKIDWKSPVVKLETNYDLSKRAFDAIVLKSIVDKGDDRTSSDDEQLIVKKRKQEKAKAMIQSDTNSSDSDSEESMQLNRLRNRKSLSASKSADGIKSLKTPTKEEMKMTEESLKLKKPGFGDGSDFRPGWEEEVCRYKRSVRMPPTLIQVIRPPHWPRVSTSLPDLDPCPNSPAPSTSTEELFTQKKYSLNIYEGHDKSKLDVDSDSESMSSYPIPKSYYDSEASCSTVISTASKRNPKKNENTSIIDVLIQKCGKKEIKKKKQKEEGNLKMIPKSTNPQELLATPSLGLEKVSTKKGIKHVTKEKVMEELFYLGSFRKQTVSTFRDAFINNTDGLLGATEEFSPVVLKSRTRTETRVLKHRATIKEVFGDERPASAPPVTCSNEEPVEEEVKPVEEIKIKELKIKKIKKNVCNTVREGLRSARLKRSDAKGRLLRIKKRNSFLKALASKKNKISHSSSSKIIKKEPAPQTANAENGTSKPKDGEEPALPVKKRFKKLFNRRKLSSGFDYIRKKKKLIKNGEVPKIRRRNLIPRPSPESVQDIQKEIKNWIIKKSVGETVLHRAARLGYIDCVAYCLEKMDIPPSCRDNAGYTPLHEACSRGHLDIARLLLQYGADVSEAAQGGIRPLHEACENGYVEIIRLLLSYGADPLLATYSGQTPISLSSGKSARLLQLHLNDIQGTVPQPWHFGGPCKLMDPQDSGFDPLAFPPSPPASGSAALPPLEVVAAPAPLPPLYRLPPDAGLWCLLQDLAALLQVKSRDALLKQIHCGPGAPRDSLKELRTHEFLERAQCQQLLAAGEKINIRASKIALVRYTDKVKQLLNIETVILR